MEGAAIAHICEKNKIQFRSLKAVSDVRGQGLMISQYKKHSTDALDALSAAIQKWA
jgi:nucleoside phosphorylase